MKKFRSLLLALSILVCTAAAVAPAAAASPAEVSAPASAERIVYGWSGQGRELAAYRFGAGENVLVAGFAIHGYEDVWAQDGAALVHTAGKLMEALDARPEAWDSSQWTVYILPCMNPDGLLDGWTNNGPGRLTTTHLTGDGTVSSTAGIDMNRSFPTGWKRLPGDRCHNGTAPLQCAESRALADFVQRVRGTGRAICLDVHGWTSQIISSGGADSALSKTFQSAFPACKPTSLHNTPGYFTGYAASLGYDACLFEFPKGPTSMDRFLTSGYAETFCGCVLSLLAPAQAPAPAPEPVTPAPAPAHEIQPWSADGAGGMTRAQLVKLLARQARADTSLYPCPFADVSPDDPAAGAIGWASALGIVNGTDTGLFRPDGVLTREQLITVLTRYLAVSTGAPVTAADLSAYSDVERVSPYCREAMGQALALGLLNDCADGFLRPDQPVSFNDGFAMFVQLNVFLSWTPAASVSAPPVPVL